jgi:predicted PurR-regulated permease PerM
MKQNLTQKVEISYRTIIFTVLLLISLTFVWQLRSIIVLFFLCYVLMEALNPAVNWLCKFKIPRILSILILYAVIFTGVSFSLAGIIPALVEQTTNLIKNLPTSFDNLSLFGLNPVDLSSQFKILENLPGNIAQTVVSVFSNLLSIFALFMITFYLLIERKNFDNYAGKAFGPKGQIKANIIIEELEKRLGSWVSAQLLLMIIIGVLAYFGYALIGLNYAVPLAIIAGLLELVPNIGPTVSTVLAAFVGLTISPLTALLAVIWGIVIQQLENNFIVPKIMKETVGLNPLITILLIASGAKLGGVLGAIIAIPVFLTASTIIRVWRKK